MKIKESLINPYNKPKLKILIKYTLLLPLLMLMVFVLELVPVLLSLLLVMVLVALVVAAAAGGGCGAATSDWVCFNKLNGFLEVKYARIFWIYLSKNNDSMYFKYC